MRIITNKYGAINAPKRLPSMYKSSGQFDYAVYRANLKNHDFTDRFPTYASFKETMNNQRLITNELTGIEGTTQLNARALEMLGRSRTFMTQEEVGAANLYNAMLDTPDFDKVDWTNMHWDKEKQGYVSNGFIIVFNYGDEYSSQGLYKIIPLRIL